jgi:hypothetical protein
MPKNQHRTLLRRPCRLAVWLGTCLLLPLAPQAQDRSMPAPAARTASGAQAPAPASSIAQVPKLRPLTCRPEDFDPKCLQQADQAFASLAEVARLCPECASRIPPRPSRYPGKPIRPTEFCKAVETVARLNGMSITCTAE